MTTDISIVLSIPGSLGQDLTCSLINWVLYLESPAAIEQPYK